MSETLKVMLVLTRLNVGGVSHQAILLGKGLQTRGCAVQLVCGQEEAHEGNMLDLAAAEGLQVIRVPTLRRRISPLNDLRAFLILWRLMRRERPHVVQTNMAKAGQLGRLTAYLTGVPVIFHVFHGHVFHSYFDSLVTRIFTALERWMGRISDGVITLTDGLRQELASYRIAPEADIRVISSLIDFGPLQDGEHQRGQFRAELGIPREVSLIGLVGRLVSVKNPQMFLDAAALLRQTHPNSHFVLVGDGELRSEMENYAREEELNAAVTFTGWRDDLPRIYADLNVVVISSLNEGSPISILEAVAAGVPVVATRVGGVPDLLADGVTGMLVESGDTVALAEAIGRLLDQPAEAQAMAEAARRALSGRFDIDQQVERYLTTYHKVLESKGLDPPPPNSISAVDKSAPAGSVSRRVDHLERTV
jgi:glycosyltransferase involved in cell wall biosynthesis